MYHEAVQRGPDWDSNLTTRAAAMTAESADFHWQLARQSGPWPFHIPATVQRKHWRWQGFMTGKRRPGASHAPASAQMEALAAAQGSEAVWHVGMQQQLLAACRTSLSA